jgi:hypothetical protein
MYREDNEPFRFGATAGNRQVLAAPRFTIAWSPSAVEAAGPDRLAEFQVAFSALLMHLRAESAPGVYVVPASPGMRDAFVTMANIDGTIVTYPSRNTCYTNIGGVMMAEAIEPDLPADPAMPLGGIPNPLNYEHLNLIDPS